MNEETRQRVIDLLGILRESSRPDTPLYTKAAELVAELSEPPASKPNSAKEAKQIAKGAVGALDALCKTLERLKLLPDLDPKGIQAYNRAAIALRNAGVPDPPVEVSDG